ncbi:flagellar export chaperone FliS [Bordetella sp. 02P26C-1]|uniref:flagellar export chaperone FliS n=1 Tax=Bordetella sp. 02P26C-1 TaxID=2683195 RepID=UPI001355BC85|nr:flagellar export chaperone FliS [Bordetella sp. 02P26C-1]MVW77507.1 flagellar export chaperone FliS [Bordetella sp. 02P26C-1]
MMTTPLRGSRRLAHSYATVGLETSVRSASPVKLISMLFDAARSSVTKAQFHLEAGQVPERGAAISKALDIILHGLKASVDESQGEVAKSLILSYDLMAHHLLLANVQANAEHLNTVLAMLDDLSSAWNAATGQLQA